MLEKALVISIAALCRVLLRDPERSPPKIVTDLGIKGKESDDTTFLSMHISTLYLL